MGLHISSILGYGDIHDISSERRRSIRPCQINDLSSAPLDWIGNVSLDIE
jgi:hypothetical protein